MTTLILLALLMPVYAQQNLPYSRNVQWVDFVRPVTVISTTTTSISISTPLPTTVTNIPSVQIVSGTVSLSDSLNNRVIIRDGTANRNLAVNAYNGLDVRLMNNTGVLISPTNPLPVNITSATITTNVNITNTPDVNVANTPNVNIVNTPNVNVINNPFVQADPYYMAITFYIDTNTTDLVVKNGWGCLYHVLVGTPGKASVLKIYDGNKQIAEISTIYAGYYPLQCRFDTNLRITTEGTIPAKITIVYK